MTPVTVGVVGVGQPFHHLPALARLEQATLIGLCDLDETRLEEAGQRFGVRARFTDYRRMLEVTRPRAVYVVPSVVKTYEIAAECLDRRHHCFVEKPPGMSVEETRQLARIARARGVISMVGFNRRFHPLVMTARAVLAEAGPPATIVTEWYKPLLMTDMGRDFPPAVVERLLSVTTIHAIDTLRWLGGEVDEILAVGGRFFSPYVDGVHALLRFRRGGVGVLLSGYHTTKVERLQIHAAGVFVELSGTEAPYREGRVCRGRRWEPLWPAPGDRTDPDGFFDEDRHFVDCVAAGRPVGPEGADLADAVGTMALAEAIAGAVKPGWEGARP